MSTTDQMYIATELLTDLPNSRSLMMSNGLFRFTMHCSVKNHHKYWQYNASTQTLQWGRIGASPQSRTKTRSEFYAAMRKKIAKGYRLSLPIQFPYSWGVPYNLAKEVYFTGGDTCVLVDASGDEVITIDKASLLSHLEAFHSKTIK